MWSRSLAAPALALLLGCEPADPYQVGPTCPVEGTVWVDRRPCRVPGGGFGRVWLYPDVRKGNACPQVPSGDVGADGRFRIRTRDRDGAPPGWYRVQVVARGVAGKDRATRPIDLVAPRYGDAARSGLTLHVVADAAAGTYDLRLRR